MLIKSVILRQGKEHVAEGCKKANVPSIPKLIEMAMDVMGLTKDDFMEGIEVGGAVTFFGFAKDADVSLTF